MATKTTDPKAELEAIRASIMKKYGPTTLHKASESVPVNRVPFIEPQLNYATMGGAPFGRFTAMYGQPNSGKSRVALELIAQAQQLPGSAEIVLIPRIAHHSALCDDVGLPDDVRHEHEMMAENLDRELSWLRQEFPRGAEAVLYNAEIQFDRVWAEEWGVDNSRLEIFESVTIEEITEVAAGLYPHYPMHVIDSTTNCSSLLTQAQDATKSDYGTNARQWKNELRKSMTRWDIERNMGVLIHQMSTNNKTGGLQSTATNYMNFVTRLYLRFDHGRFLWLKDGMLLPDKPEGADKESMSGRAPADGREVYVSVEKSTVGRPHLTAGLQWSYREKQFVWVHELAAAALFYGVVVKSGTWYKVAGESETIGQGMKALYRRLHEDAGLRAEVLVRLLDFVTNK